MYDLGRSMPLASGARLGPYEILSSLGAGGMGEVYRARDSRLDRDVAIKILPQHLAVDKAAVARFEQEGRAVAALSHPNILAIHDVGQQDGVAYVVTELLDGDTLRDRLAGGRLPLRKAIEFAMAIAQGLAAAHAKGITHRDIKPENVFVTADGHVKILDFGLAKVTAPAAESRGRRTCRPIPARCSAPPATSLLNRRRAAPPIIAPTSSPSAPCSTRWPPACARSRATRRSTRCTR